MVSVSCYFINLCLFPYSKLLFRVSGIESTRNWRITYLFYFVLKFLGFLRFFLCASLSLNLESRKMMPPGKIVSWNFVFQ